MSFMYHSVLNVDLVTKSTPDSFQITFKITENIIQGQHVHKKYSVQYCMIIIILLTNNVLLSSSGKIGVFRL